MGVGARRLQREKRQIGARHTGTIRPDRARHRVQMQRYICAVHPNQSAGLRAGRAENIIGPDGGRKRRAGTLQRIRVQRTSQLPQCGKHKFLQHAHGLVCGVVVMIACAAHLWCVGRCVGVLRHRRMVHAERSAFRRRGHIGIMLGGMGCLHGRMVWADVRSATMVRTRSALSGTQVCHNRAPSRQGPHCKQDHC